MRKKTPAKSPTRTLIGRRAARHAAIKRPSGTFEFALIRQAVCLYFDAMQSECNGQHEKGGILIGCYRGPHLDVVDLTEPGPDDLASLFSFRRKDRRHQNAATDAWRQSGETLTYVGEWHTHPFGAPHPSSLDRKTWHSVIKRLKAPCVFVVISPSGWSVFRVSGLVQAAKLSKLLPIDYGDTGIVFGDRKPVHPVQAIAASTNESPLHQDDVAPDEEIIDRIETGVLDEEE